jgi:quercetin dioxygenase-like cupin family protein
LAAAGVVAIRLSASSWPFGENCGALGTVRLSSPSISRRRYEVAAEPSGDPAMHVFNLKAEEQFDPKKHVERVLGRVAEGDVTVACWEPGQASPYHCHPHATEIYFCFEGGGTMKTPERTVDVVAGSLVVHPPGELHEWRTGPQRTLLFRVRYGGNMQGRTKEWPSNSEWRPRPEDIEYFAGG